MKTSILMLTHDAHKYVKESIVSVKEKTRDENYELIVVDNASKFWTRMLLKRLQKKAYIDKLYFNSTNALFAKGNNLASTFADENSNFILLLNSDISIKDSKWLSKLIEIHPQEGGISSFGAVEEEPIRADGYCMLIDKYLYDKYKLDEQYEWFWGVTKLESEVLKEGLRIVAVKNHEKYIHHYGGKSGKGYANAKGLDIDITEVSKWFSKGKVEILDYIE